MARMKELLNSIKSIGFVGVYCFAMMHSAYADDIDIFGSPQLQSTANPNILFLIDTSLSMREQDIVETSPSDPNWTNGSCGNFIKTVPAPTFFNPNRTINTLAQGCSRYDTNCGTRTIRIELNGRGGNQQVTVLNCKDRLDVVQSALTSIISNQNFRGYNVGLARFSMPGGVILHPVEPLEDANGQERVVAQTTFRNLLLDEVNNLTHEGFTPGSGALLETIAYFRGERPEYGDIRGEVLFSSSGFVRRSAVSAGVSSPLAFQFVPDISYDNPFPNSQLAPHLQRPYNTNDLLGFPNTPRLQNIGPNRGQLPNPEVCKNNFDFACTFERLVSSQVLAYKTPIDAQDTCQVNRLILLGDGAFNVYTGRTEARFNSWPKPAGWSQLNANEQNCTFRGQGQDTLSDTTTYFFGGNDDGAQCSKNIVRFAADPNSSSLTRRGIQTDTIGFANAGVSQFLRELAQEGNGDFYAANDEAQLLNVFTNILTSVIEENASFVSAATTVSQANRLFNNDELYYTLFKPESGGRWLGNLKKYRIDGSGDLVGANGAPVIVNEVLNDQVQSFWSSGIDGDIVEAGGALEQSLMLASLPRNLLTDVGVTSGNLTTFTSTTAPVKNALDATLSDAEKEKTLLWALGYDVDSATPNQPHNVFAEPLHSAPVLMQYGNGKSLVFFGSNHGFLHAVDATTGREEWAYIPESQLKDLHKVRENAPSINVGHIYGLDGNVVTYHEDTDLDDIIDAGETAYLIIGQRRGGKEYFVLDISNPSAPEKRFTLTNADFGQTWSTPVIGKVRINGVTKTVMVIGGGYDLAFDNLNTTNATEGNAIYMVDINNGNIVWNSRTDAVRASGASAGATAMGSVPADVQAFDLDNDDLLDHIYSSDTQGQVFRFDIPSDITSTTRVIGGRIADLGGSGSDNRRFFYKPDIAVIRNAITGIRSLSVALGSGMRPSPFDKTLDERFFVFFDEGPLNEAAPWTNVTNADLTDVSQLLGPCTGAGCQTGESLASNTIRTQSKKGWYISFKAQNGGRSIGEKVVSASTTFNNAVLFTTYVPPGSGAVSPCANGDIGISRVYSVNIEDGTPVTDVVQGNFLTDVGDRYLGVGRGIASEPAIVILNDGPHLVIGRNMGSDYDDMLPKLPQGLIPKSWYHEPSSFTTAPTP